MNFDNVDNVDNVGKGNEFNNEFHTINMGINLFFMFTFFYNFLVVINFLCDKGPLDYVYIYLNNDLFNFIKNFEFELSQALLKYNGIYSDSDSSSSDTSELESISEPDVVVKYEDKYLDDIKKMSITYKFSWNELEIRDNKFNELYNAHKINLVNEKYNLNQEIVEKSVKYIEIDDESDSSNTENSNEISSDSNSDSNSNDFSDNIEERKKIIELEIVELRSKLKELEEISEDEIIAKLKLEAHDFVIKYRLDGLKNSFIIEKTPLGNVIMYWNNSRESFEYYSDNTIPYRYLETVGRKYVKTFNCRQIYIDMEFELREFERRKKENQDLKMASNLELKKDVEQKKNVFAKFKNYNTESGTGRVNRGVAPPKNSIPNNNNNMKNSSENVILKENSNRYTCEGRMSNFSILKKPDRKVIDKKYAMSFADFKKGIFMKKV